MDRTGDHKKILDMIEHIEYCEEKEVNIRLSQVEVQLMKRALRIYERILTELENMGGK